MIPAAATSESVRVDLPWSTWAITDMDRMFFGFDWISWSWPMVKLTCSRQHRGACQLRRHDCDTRALARTSARRPPPTAAAAAAAARRGWRGRSARLAWGFAHGRRAAQPRSPAVAASWAAAACVGAHHRGPCGKRVAAAVRRTSDDGASAGPDDRSPDQTPANCR